AFPGHIMKIRFQADADLHQTIVSATVRREPQIDFQTANAAGLEGLSDSEVLAMATSAGRLLISHDQSTMPRHFSVFIQQRESPGLFIPQGLSLVTAVEEILLIWHASSPEEWINRYAFAPL
ncbi:MAG: DUF5615 family PIN-like protein, partial [Blastocatellia bacterium]